MHVSKMYVCVYAPPRLGTVRPDHPEAGWPAAQSDAPGDLRRREPAGSVPPAHPHPYPSISIHIHPNPIPHIHPSVHATRCGVLPHSENKIRAVRRRRRQLGVRFVREFKALPPPPLVSPFFFSSSRLRKPRAKPPPIRHSANSQASSVAFRRRRATPTNQPHQPSHPPSLKIPKQKKKEEERRRTPLQRRATVTPPGASASDACSVPPASVTPHTRAHAHTHTPPYLLFF
ncbi:hypothetical protein DFH11DRAFT_542549 [Phellopilus nigrolimitatus]|nr:hypothetical protein DFH11DRAFT_542549 [Phellopilus nigrolimitatus]